MGLSIDVPSTPRSTHNVQTNVVDADVVPQAGSYQPTPPEGVKQPKKDKPKTDTSSSDIAEVVKVIKRRKRASQRCGCKALLRLRKTPCGNKYVVYAFFEKHNHRLVHENDYKYLRASRKLTFSKQQLLRQLSEANIGPTRAWKITNPYLSLVEFLSHYDTAVDSQRYIYGKNTHNSNYTAPDLKTHLVIEKEAADFYTHTIFYDVQDKIWASFMDCCSLSVQESESCSTFVIRDTEADYRIKGSWVQAKYEVTYVPDPCSAKCTCLRYECYGLLCRHIFYVLRMSRVFHFPKQYMDNRWSKHAMTHRSVDANKASPSSTNSDSVVDATVREIYSNVEESLHHLVGDIQKLHIYRDDQTTLMEKAKLDVPNPPNLNTKEAYARTLGVTEPEELTIFTRTGINNKGQVMRTRRKSKSEIAIELSDKPMTMCKTCHKLARHDSRNCPTKKNKGLKDEDVDQYMDDSD
ncbi:FAR1 DNA binding domain, Zinc finger, SWIM-type, MULE transposase domain, FHY3/FAR1 family [Artemisia annua]|uniref:FAR1 DNA binding domain, Zinc finger, SWIM-type, MULE transposase domain, FHY3/FAR1 family n=1 Tax=Artemisia annua TaxID=35608 RepID=A0A2U1PMS7_ARTAN|nr:FAR1 DNA binding domain, Zinc finger, SWIM-type, MULE transposase domain, FHY3/FAR1 family [Artemisia annua]